MGNWNDVLSQEINCILIFLRVDKVSGVLGIRVYEVVKQRRYEQCHLKAPCAINHSVAHKCGICDYHFNNFKLALR